MTYLKFNNKFFKQNYSLPVLAGLFLEILKSDPFRYRLPNNTSYLKYIADILCFLPQKIKIEENAEKLNNVEPSINFTYEKKK